MIDDPQVFFWGWDLRYQFDLDEVKGDMRRTALVSSASATQGKVSQVMGVPHGHHPFINYKF